MADNYHFWDDVQQLDKALQSDDVNSMTRVAQELWNHGGLDGALYELGTKQEASSTGFMMTDNHSITQDSPNVDSNLTNPKNGNVYNLHASGHEQIFLDFGHEPDYKWTAELVFVPNKGNSVAIEKLAPEDPRHYNLLAKTRAN